MESKNDNDNLRKKLSLLDIDNISQVGQSFLIFEILFCQKKTLHPLRFELDIRALLRYWLGFS